MGRIEREAAVRACEEVGRPTPDRRSQYLDCVEAIRALPPADDAALVALNDILALVRRYETDCTKAERERVADICNRPENAPILTMLHEQRFAWEQKALAYANLAGEIERRIAALPLAHREGSTQGGKGGA